MPLGRSKESEPEFAIAAEQNQQAVDAEPQKRPIPLDSIIDPPQQDVAVLLSEHTGAGAADHHGSIRANR
jgi:hypothetical protein